MILLQIIDDGSMYSGSLKQVYNYTEKHFEILKNVSRAIGGIGALFYISFRIWRHMANAEPINFFPLLRPFVICLCILFFPLIIDIINGVLYQTIKFSKNLKAGELDFSFECDSSLTTWKIVKQVVKVVWGWFKSLFTKKNETDWTEVAMVFNCDFTKKVVVILKGVFEAARIGINIVRIFFLVLLNTFGPLTFAFSIFDGFERNLSTWFKKYISIYLWLPVSHILYFMCTSFFNKIDAKNSFLLITAQAVVCTYCFLKVPEISGWIVEAPGGFEREWGSKGAGFVINNAKEAIKGVASKGKK